jgi:hypothetical protein
MRQILLSCTALAAAVESFSSASTSITYRSSIQITKGQRRSHHPSKTNKRSVALHLMPDEDEKDYISPMRQRPPPKGGDVAYTNQNILRQLRHYNDIRKAGGKDCVQDIYARDPNTSADNTRFWFVGKVARCTGTVSAEAAIARQMNLLEEHATRIRPVELGRSFGRLEFWFAPGDSESLTSQNDIGTRLQKVMKTVEGSDKVPLLEVGLDLSIVTNRGAGFYIIRTEDGVVPPHMIGM